MPKHGTREVYIALNFVKSSGTREAYITDNQRQILSHNINDNQRQILNHIADNQRQILNHNADNQRQIPNHIADNQRQILKHIADNQRQILNHNADNQRQILNHIADNQHGTREVYIALNFVKVSECQNTEHVRYILRLFFWNVLNSKIRNMQGIDCGQYYQTIWMPKHGKRDVYIALNFVKSS